MKQLRCGLAAQLAGQAVALLITGLLLAGIVHGLVEILGVALAHWQQPNLFGDSFAFVQRNPNQPLIGWLTAQHNEHRIVWAKAASLVETEVLKIPPGQSALFQNLALILGCAGLWSWLCQRLLQRSDLRLITVLAGWLLLVNPWQYENLGWEFQTPWFLINALVLIGAVLLSAPPANIPQSPFRWQRLLAVLLPWLALSSTGQGLAFAVAFCACAWLRSPRLGGLVSLSTGLASLTFFALLPYSKPAGHPELSFQLDYFLRAWLGGPWQGLAVLCLVVAGVLLGRRKTISKQSWPALLMPGLFSLIFAGMITLSRAGFGLEQANSSRYITHSLMLGLTALLALALIDDHSRRAQTPLLGGFLVLITTLGSFPQGMQANGLSYSGAWAEGQRWAEQKRQRFLCHAEQAGLAARNIRLIEPCKEIHPRQRMVDRYFQGAWPVKPLGWHQQLLTSRGAGGPIRHQLDQQTLKATSLHLQGWAFQTTAPNQDLYLLATYGADEQLAIPIDQPRRDVKRAHDLPKAKVGFDAVLPRTLAGQHLRIVHVGTANNNAQIWEDPSVNG
jgi:hypothetical protein